MRSLVTVLLQMFSDSDDEMFENWSISDEVKAYKTKCASFFGPPCIVEQYDTIGMFKSPKIASGGSILK